MKPKFREDQAVAFSGDADASYKIVCVRGDTATISNGDERFVAALEDLTPLEPPYLSPYAAMVLDLSAYVTDESVAWANAKAEAIQASTHPLSHYVTNAVPVTKLYWSKYLLYRALAEHGVIDAEGMAL